MTPLILNKLNVLPNIRIGRGEAFFSGELGVLLPHVLLSALFFYVSIFQITNLYRWF
jgi:hypothetical protein